MSRTSEVDARPPSNCANCTPIASHLGIALANESAPPTDRILRLPEVLEIVGIGRTSLYGMVKTGRFPAPLHLSERMRGWKLSAILKYLASLEAEQ
ncbi:MAG: AlpA family phage regulatory protein [Paraburkholderia sp.]|uniref:helix-turn-helix transcriptional regulator n=1 Tax=Paraburkholderia sp. TaxID=1926495 RepID=UPI0011FA7B30|nr:AlpA family phage regulatory protein [Paraburkholderia sp.]TAM01409.1 MAG: AlpA family phage regulatory protein [Paraburkholderia sp.]TAM30118.1 MAG: AlpA family phage regulatory protein [Paraburkholderia sp.]